MASVLTWGVLGIAIASAQVGGPPPSCNPFGDPPREVFPNPVVTTCLDGRRIGPWLDPDGTPRHACLYEPASAAAASSVPLPLVVYLQPSLFTADTILDTSLLDFLDSANLTGDRSRLGFYLLAPEGRFTSHFYPAPDDRGTGWDNWYRQLAPSDVHIGGVSYPQNVDAAAIDHFIAAMTATGKIDTRRIYVTGWSNGAAMAYLYALNRPQVASIAVYTAPNPFRAFNDPCPQTPVARAPRDDSEIQISNRRLPAMHVHNDCDIAGICPNGELLRSQLVPLGVAFRDVIIDSQMRRVRACMAACGTNPNGDMNPLDNPMGFTVGSQNHTRWPRSWTEKMLRFFRAHPLRR
jgi:hypothetical protein